MFAADLHDLMYNDISKIAEYVEISVPDSTDGCDETTRVCVINQQQVNQVNNHVNHIHVHAPLSSQCAEDTLESGHAVVKNKSVTSSHEIKTYNNLQFTQNRKLIFDSKVVPIKPDDRSALQKQVSVVHTQLSRQRSASIMKAVQSTEVSAST